MRYFGPSSHNFRQEELSPRIPLTWGPQSADPIPLPPLFYTPSYGPDTAVLSDSVESFRTAITISHP